MKAYPFCFAKPAVKAAGFVRAGGDVKPVTGDTVGQILGADRGWRGKSVQRGIRKTFRCRMESLSLSPGKASVGPTFSTSLAVGLPFPFGTREEAGLASARPWCSSCAAPRGRRFVGGRLQTAPPLGPQRPLPGRSVSVGNTASRGSPFSPGAFGHRIGPALEPHTRVTLLR